MELQVRRNRPRPAGGVAARAVSRARPAWDWDTEIAAAISMVARNPRYHVVISATAQSCRALTRLETSAASLGVVLERRIRPGGGWDVEVRPG